MKRSDEEIKQLAEEKYSHVNEFYADLLEQAFINGFKSCQDSQPKVDVEEIWSKFVLECSGKLMSAIDMFEWFKPYLQQQEESGWISVNDILPEIGCGVLVFLKSKFITIGYLRKKTNAKTVWQLFGDMEKITDLKYASVKHWQPLPKPPIK